MKRTISLLAIAIAFGAHTVFAADYDVDPAHTSVGFNIRHMVSHVNGTFKDFTGNFSFDAKKPSASVVDFSVKTESIDTQNEKRDKHLRSADFFDVEKFPNMTFKSTKVTPAGKNKYKVTGDLTLHGVTRPETFDIEFGGEMKDPWGNQRAGFSATGTINRKNYGIIWNKALDTGAVMLGDDVNVAIQVEATQKAAAKKM